MPPSDHTQERYARQMRYAPIGARGQALLSGAHAAIIGVGALGCVTANHLARAGVGRLTLIDRDVVEMTNLQRQMLYDEQDAAAGTPKAVAAARRLSSLNGDIDIRTHAVDLTAANIEVLLSGTDLLIDGTDNFGVRYLLNEWSVKTGTPWIYSAAVGASGMTMTILPGLTPCLRCLFPQTPAGGSLDTCETAGVLAPIVDTIASIASMEALKLLSGNSSALHGTLLQVDLWQMGWQPLSVAQAKRSDCPVCGEREFAALDQRAQEPMTAALCGRQTIQVTPALPSELDLERLAIRWQPLGLVEKNAYLLRLRRDDGLVFALFPDGRALVSGTDDPIRARRLYTEIMGE